MLIQILKKRRSNIKTRGYKSVNLSSNEGQNKESPLIFH